MTTIEGNAWMEEEITQLKIKLGEMKEEIERLSRLVVKGLPEDDLEAKLDIRDKHIDSLKKDLSEANCIKGDRACIGSNMCYRHRADQAEKDLAISNGAVNHLTERAETAESKLAEVTVNKLAYCSKLKQANKELADAKNEILRWSGMVHDIRNALRAVGNAGSWEEVFAIIGKSLRPDDGPCETCWGAKKILDPSEPIYKRAWIPCPACQLPKCDLCGDTGWETMPARLHCANGCKPKDGDN